MTLEVIGGIPVNDARIVQIQWATLQGSRPRPAGKNARLEAHGSRVNVPLARLTCSDGSTGFGFCRTDREQANRLLGQSLNAVFSAGSGVAEPWLAFEYPIWDLVGRRMGVPVYHLAATVNEMGPPETLHVPCYDTSLYFDDLHLGTDSEAADLMASQAREGYDRGHRAFKIKVGRGARHMPLMEGTDRDIAIIQAVRQTVGQDCPLMIDANNGYNLNLAKRVLLETRNCRLFWLEEAFHEDPVLYRDLKQWQVNEGLSILIADGEGEASPNLMQWAKEGLVDVIQYDIFGHGLTRWLAIGRQLDSWKVRSAPHHYGGHYGNYAACHLAAAVTGFTFAEWDEATTPGLDTSAYIIHEGHVHVPELPGFGLALDEAAFRHAVEQNGGMLRGMD